MSSDRADLSGPRRPIAVTGAGGFVASHLIPYLRNEGFPIRAVIRSTLAAARLRGLGCEVAVGDVQNRASLVDAFGGCGDVIHLVAIIRERGGRTFAGINRGGTANAVGAARDAGVTRFLHMSALGAGPTAPRYLRSKWAGEEEVRRGGMPYVIFRPSFMLGSGGGSAVQFGDAVRFGLWYPLVQLIGGRKFFSALAALVPLVPVLGSGKYRSMPVAISDVAQIVRHALDRNDVFGRAFDIGGPEILTYDEIVMRVGAVLGLRRRLIHFPAPVASAVISLFRLLPNPPITRDEAESLFIDTIADNRDILETFAVRLTPLDAALRQALRPHT